MSIKTNDTGIDLKDAQLEIAGDEPPTPAAAPTPAQPSPLPSPAFLQPDPASDVDLAEDRPSERQMTIASEDRVQRRQLILKINSYYASRRFGAHLKKSELVEDLSTLTIPEMANLLQDIQFCVQNKTSSNMLHNMVP